VALTSISQSLIDALGNLNGFFDSLANNLHTMENRNLLPNQMRLLGESEYRPAAFPTDYINSIRNYRPQKSIRQLVDYEPGKVKLERFLIKSFGFASHPPPFFHRKP